MKTTSRARRVWRGFALSMLVAGLAAGQEAGPVVEVTYLANEGFLIAAGERKVLVDALFPGIRGYPRLGGELKDDLLAARPPFDGVDLVLATHHHWDHFGAEEVRRFLAANPVPFISTPQALERLRQVAGELPADASAVRPDSPVTLELAAGITVTTLDLHHGRDRDPPVENLGFLIDLDGFKILHVGDSEATAEDFRRSRLGDDELDLALLPVWYLTEPRWRPAVDQEIRPARIVAMHLAEPGAPASWFGSAGSFTERIAQVESAYPGAWIPTAPLERRSYPLAPAVPGTRDAAEDEGEPQHRWSRSSSRPGWSSSCSVP